MTFLKKDECYKMMGKKTYIIQENAKRLAVKKKMVDVGRNKWAANLREKGYTYMYMYREEKRKKKMKIRSSQTSEKRRTEKRTTTANATHT